MARPLIEASYPGEPTSDLDGVERILTQLQGFDPTSEHFRYPILRDGSETLTSLGLIHMRRFHEVMEEVAGLLDGAETGIRVMTDDLNEAEAAMAEYYGSSDDHY